MFKTVFGRVWKAFDHWKKIPSDKQLKKNEAAVTVSNIFTKCYLKALKNGWDPLEKLFNYYRNKRIWAIRELVNATTGRLRDKFSIWANFVVFSKILKRNNEILNATSKLTEIMKIHLGRNTEKLYNAPKLIKGL